MEKTEKQKQSELLKESLGLTYLTRATLDPYSANKYLLKDIWKNNKKSQIHNLGWDDPKEIPFYPDGDAYRAATSGSQYNKNFLVVGQKMIEYDFNEAYTNIMRTYALPSNTFLTNASFDREKIEKRFAEYDPKHPFRKLSTFVFLTVEIIAEAKPDTYTEWGSAFYNYSKTMYGQYTLSEVELKLILDFYDVKKLEVVDSYVFRNRQGLLEDYFQRVDVLKERPETVKLYKAMRNKIYGTIGAVQLKKVDEKIFKFPIYNRAFSSAVAGIFRDRMSRYEQKYVNSEYGLVMIKTDGIYFVKEVPEFELFTKAGIVKKKIHVINEDDVFAANVMG